MHSTLHARRLLSLLTLGVTTALLSGTLGAPASFAEEPARTTRVALSQASLPALVGDRTGLSVTAAENGTLLDPATTVFTAVAGESSTSQVLVDTDSIPDGLAFAGARLSYEITTSPEDAAVRIGIVDRNGSRTDWVAGRAVAIGSTSSDTLTWAFDRAGDYVLRLTAEVELTSAADTGASAPTGSADTTTGTSETADRTLTSTADYAVEVSVPAVGTSTDRGSTSAVATPAGSGGATATARGTQQAPRADADEDAGDGSDETDPDPAAWDVPNHSTTASGATIITEGHIDVASLLEGGTLVTRIKDDSDLAAGTTYRDPATTVLQVRPEAQTTVPAVEAYAFLGEAGSALWQVSETQQAGLLWPGWSTEAIPVAATQTGVTWSLDRISGPGEFALYTTSLSSPNVLYNTRDGITEKDSFEIPKNSHVHGSWAFSTQGTYCLGFTRSTRSADGTNASDTFTLAIAVGEVDVTRIDPAACFARTDEPSEQDVTPVPEPQLTDATTGGIEVLGGDAGFTPGQLVTVQVGASHAGQWVSVWLDSTTWLGWVQADSGGAVQVRLPAGSALGSHKLVVKADSGDLIGWDALSLVTPPEDPGDDSGDDPGNGTTPPPNTTTGCEAETTIISAGHLDYSTQVVGGRLQSLIGDDSSGRKVFREPSETVLWLKPSSKVRLSAGYERVAPAGTSVFLGPQTQNSDLIWLGWSTELVNSSHLASPVTWNLDRVEGPGEVSVFLQGAFGGIEKMVFDGAGSYQINLGVHAHANWAFTKAGIYRLHFTQSATLASGQRSSDTETLTIAVGDVDPVSAVDGGADCVDTSGGGATVAKGTTTNPGADTATDAVRKKRTTAAECTPTRSTVLSSGHMDWNAQIVGGKLESLIGDDSTGSRVYRDPGSTVLWLKPSSKVTLPSGFSQIGAAGSTVWQIPQTQEQSLVWLGWSTELLNAGNASSAVTWTLTEVEGPGTVAVYTIGSFSGVQDLVFDGTGTSSIALGVHAHANWAFSKQGVYRLHFTQSVRLAGGRTSSDSEVLTIAVGDVDPTTVTTSTTGCGAVSNGARSGVDTTADQARVAADQAVAEAAEVAAAELPGEGSDVPGPGASNPFEELANGNPVPLLLDVLGGLLLLGAVGTGGLWWRRRRWEGVAASASGAS
ncbi:TIGR03773 family transporter-associated surface protein [Propionicicella superfundia]|uniref:TIGR03773 family transporter-associated surface protein n=1 Tax=Propionicicella superfundia TaxID=348582 RepID=UPI000429F66D|nr:TIGR03773 family transporter-associated surface protein [Propionicicella superfundia]